MAFTMSSSFNNRFGRFVSGTSARTCQRMAALQHHQQMQQIQAQMPLRRWITAGGITIPLPIDTPEDQLGSGLRPKHPGQAPKMPPAQDVPFPDPLATPAIDNQFPDPFPPKALPQDGQWPPASAPPSSASAASADEIPAMPKEIGGRMNGPEPTRFGDWEKGGRCVDF